MILNASQIELAEKKKCYFHNLNLAEEHINKAQKIAIEITDLERKIKNGTGKTSR